MTAQLTAEAHPHYRVAVLGAGMSGLCMAIELRKHGIGDFIILEKAAAVGGTWRENTYPGVACDVPSHVYSFSFELNPDWSHAFSGGEEIRAYCERCVERYGLTPHLQFNAEVQTLVFDGSHWQVSLKDGRRLSADLVVSGLGGLHRPNHAAIDGRESFAGRVFHTAEWDHGHDLTDRKVAIIGTGASTAQVLPSIAPDVAEVTVFQRSAAWVFPRMAREITPARRERYRRFPLLMRLHRWLIWLVMDALGTLSLRRGSALHARIERRARAFLDSEVRDPEIRRQLTPDYAAGCKRRCISDDYLASFNRPNVHLVTEAITRIEETGIRDASGKLHEVDTIVEATGFRPFDIHEYVDIRGRDGIRLQDQWRERVESYRTVMAPGFPNFFMLLGPNSATGHTSALIMIESQARFVIRCLNLLTARGARHVEPTADATRKFNFRIQRDMQKMVFSGGCNAWYTDENDHNYTLWPYSAMRFCAEFLRLKPEELKTDR